MLETSKDIFWLVLALVILWIGFFTGWGVFYLVMILSDFKKITGSLRKKMDLVDQILEAVKKRVEMTADYLPPLIEGAAKLISRFKNQKSKKKK